MLFDGDGCYVSGQLCQDHSRRRREKGDEPLIVVSWISEMNLKENRID